MEEAALAAASAAAIGNLKRFAVVGVVERYGAFLDLVQRLLDPAWALGRSTQTQRPCCLFCPIAFYQCSLTSLTS